LIISEDAVTAFLQSYFAPGYWSYKGLANNNASFASLLNSGFEQFFVWGDLLNYSSSTQFPVQVTTTSPAQLSWNTDGSLALSSAINIDMNAESTPYVHFQVAPLKSNLSFSISNNKLVFQPGNLNMKMQYQFDPASCKSRGGCGSIASSTIKNSIQSYLNSNTFSFPLPAIQVVGGSTLNATAIQHRSDLKSFIFTFGTAGSGNSSSSSSSATSSGSSNSRTGSPRSHGQ